MSEQLYKVLHRDGIRLVSCNGGRQEWMPGVKVEAKGPLVPCANGIHLCRTKDLIHWLNDTICPVRRASRERIVCDDKVVVRWAIIGEPLETWNDHAARLFACDCAEWALTLIEQPDPRSVDAIRVARLHAIGEATSEELSAAWSAAGSAAGSAAWSAAESAAGSAAWSAAWSAAGSAAWSAAWSAAGSAAGSAAWSAAWVHMTERLSEYLAGKEKET